MSLTACRDLTVSRSVALESGGFGLWSRMRRRDSVSLSGPSSDLQGCTRLNRPCVYQCPDHQRLAGAARGDRYVRRAISAKLSSWNQFLVYLKTMDTLGLGSVSSLALKYLARFDPLALSVHTPCRRWNRTERSAHNCSSGTSVLIIISCGVTHVEEVSCPSSGHALLELA